MNDSTTPPPLDADHPLASGRTAASPLVRAANGQRSERLPVWFMRQAGRSLPEYRAAREGIAMLDSCLRPELAAEITLQPVRRHDVDAAVFFSDIVVPLKLIGEDVDIVPGRGPVFANPVRTPAEARQFAARVRARAEDPTLFAPIDEAVRRTVAELGETPLIGFAGAPFTVAAYVVEGGPSKDHLRTRTLMLAEPDAWLELADAIAQLSGAFLEAQVRAGASVVQLFDSWAGSLSVERYRASVKPSSALALARVHALRTPTGDGVRTIHFGVGTAELLRDMHDAGADVQGVDDRIPLDEASRRLGGTVPLQGNIDPAVLGAGREVREAHVRDVVRRGFDAPAHILNLGHGVPPEADPQVLTDLVTFAHTLRGDVPPER
ncbi:uroporphyrinogen decarboxylase [Pseudoclavibacter chungangensis]|uniref:Uroporphyrinogen decarboxylase n=1 Tax=Pseudoclavibacter chungangensis TaxID=587635 RepID=A0A7J5BP53_9MICO|nr:uroporphyrinogen decarboxylase [Pseudoclavibacter chungangensis]KAB1654552.1 uroporphyrinogen decarboxylase [Pseudoclavibacter chungangensis]NYJ68215.1 uroporphyrinogen decarboxylase [Pseudoclavibacter chungangensis]